METRQRILVTHEPKLFRKLVPALCALVAAGSARYRVPAGRVDAASGGSSPGRSWFHGSPGGTPSLGSGGNTGRSRRLGVPPHRRASPVKAGSGGGSTPRGYPPQPPGRCTIARRQPHASSVQGRSHWPREAMSASLRAAEWTRTRRKRPVVSSRRWRLRPLSFFALSSPCGPRLRWSSPSGYR